MKLILGDYQIVTNDSNFIIQIKKVIRESKFTKEENIGKEVWNDIAYCTSFEQALKFLSNRVFIDNDDITDVIKEMRKYEEILKELIRKLKIDLEDLK